MTPLTQTQTEETYRYALGYYGHDRSLIVRQSERYGVCLVDPLNNVTFRVLRNKTIQYVPALVV